MNHTCHQLGSFCPECMGAEPPMPTMDLQKIKDIETQITKAAPLLLLGLAAMTLWRYKWFIMVGGGLYMYSKQNQQIVRDVTPKA